MAKTIFVRAMRVTKEWFNAIQNIQFDDADMDGHYPRLLDDALSNAPGNLKPEFRGFRDALKVIPVNNLTVRVSAGSITLQNGVSTPIPDTQIVIPDDSVRVVFINSEGQVQQAASAPQTGVLLARVTTAGGAVSTIEDIRPRLSFQVAPITIPAAPQFVMPPAVIVPYASDVVPSGWLLCDGSTILRSEYPGLFTAIGTRYGAPSGSTFKLPDYRSRTLTGAASPTAIGEYLGNDQVILNQSQMPQHTHALSDPGHAHAIYDPGHAHAINDPGHRHSLFPFRRYNEGTGARGDGAELTTVAGGSNDYPSTTDSGSNLSIRAAGTNVGIYASSTNISMAAVGGNQPIDIRPKQGTVNYIIKT